MLRGKSGKRNDVDGKSIRGEDFVSMYRVLLASCDVLTFESTFFKTRRCPLCPEVKHKSSYETLWPHPLKTE